MANFITKDDFLKFSGRDLELEFKNGNYDISEPVPMFIKRVESATLNLLTLHYDNGNELETKIQANLEKFKEGMMWQINHILDYGETELDKLDKTAKMIFTNLGMCNLRRC